MIEIDNIKLNNVYAFVKEPCEIEKIKDSRIMKAIIEAEKGNLKPLKEMYSKGYSFGSDKLIKGYYRLLGWHFSLSKYCKIYLVKMKYDSAYYEYMAPNKTCLYNVVGRHNVIEIIEK